jgi:hypothetical protein
MKRRTYERKKALMRVLVSLEERRVEATVVVGDIVQMKGFFPP